MIFITVLFLSAAGAVQAAHIDTSKSLSTTDKTWACVTLDWWPPDKCDYGNCPWFESSMLHLNLQSAKLKGAIGAFNKKVLLRLGGSLEDFVVYDVPGSHTQDGYCKYGVDAFSQPTNTTKIGYEIQSGCLPMKRWDDLNGFCQSSGCDIAFGLNALFGRTPPTPACAPEVNCRVPGPPECCTAWTGQWDPKNSEAFLRYTKDKGYKIFAFELGNELVGSKGIEALFDVQTYLQDWKNFIGAIDSVYGRGSDRPLTVVPDTSYEDDWYGEFLRQLSVNSPSLLPDVVTHHLYSLGPGVSANAWQAAINVTIMDEVYALGRQIHSTVAKSAPKARIWMGEGGGCYNSGSNGVTNAFNSGFWFLDQMGSFAATGHGAFCRQTLAGGYYGLLDTDANGNVLGPNPDYYSMLLWSQLMGQTVLKATNSNEDGLGDQLRIYSHCLSNDAPSYRTGAVAVLIINLSNTTAAQISSLSTTEQNNLLSLARDEYLLTSACGDEDERTLLACRQMLLNGQLLSQADSGDIAPMIPKTVNDGSPIFIKPLSYGFIVVQSAAAGSC